MLHLERPLPRFILGSQLVGAVVGSQCPAEIMQVAPVRRFDTVCDLDKGLEAPPITRPCFAEYSAFSNVRGTWLGY